MAMQEKKEKMARTDAMDLTGLTAKMVLMVRPVRQVTIKENKKT